MTDWKKTVVQMKNSANKPVGVLLAWAAVVLGCPVKNKEACEFCVLSKSS